MQHTIRIFFITLIISLSPALGLADPMQLARVDSRCIGAECVQASSAPIKSKTSMADFSPTPAQLLLAGIALIAVRILAKK